MLKNLENRVATLEKRSGSNAPQVFLVLELVESDDEGHLAVLTPEEEAVLEKYKEEVIAASKPVERFVTVDSTLRKVRGLLNQGQGRENDLGLLCLEYQQPKRLRKCANI